MGSIGTEDLQRWQETDIMTAGEQRILVAVRLRPLSVKEIEKNEVSDWECINDNTIVFKNNVAERSVFPTAYTFDRVFGSDTSTKEVYMGAAKEVVLSVVSGINSTIFAYGQTNSGKTFTMTGITEYTVAEIFDYIHQNQEREFILKFSAMEIYNETVTDLLTEDGSPLRLLDDPERGTVVEKLTEETLRGWNHMQKLLSICEEKRKIGETTLNEMSSRSHQILRLTIESVERDNLDEENSSILVASVNFVDLAGSERASLSLSSGTRLKEGCHINRSLLTLGTVIRRLSKGRNGHIPYRDSKLTRILQPSLGGNSRTAIICTMSPARSYTEQSRNTLLFASCAKKVTTNAHVNVIMSDKALVKRLQREMARLEKEMRCSNANSSIYHSEALLREKDIQIEKMADQIRKLTQQRDIAQSQLNSLLVSMGNHQSPFEKDESTLGADSIITDSCWGDITRDYDDDFENLCKEVFCIETDECRINGKGENKPLSPELNNRSQNRHNAELVLRDNSDAFTKDSCTLGQIDSLHSVKKQREGINGSSPWTLRGGFSSFGKSILTRSRSCRESQSSNSSSPWFRGPENIQKTPTNLKYNSEMANSRVENSPASEQTAPLIQNFVSGMKEIAKLQYKKQFMDCQDDAESVGGDTSIGLHSTNLAEYKLGFERQQREIIELWHTCNISLIHRTYFFLLFKGDNSSDSIYLEVEFRRLIYLKNSMSQQNPKKLLSKDSLSPTLASSAKALTREREMLSKQMLRKFSRGERIRLYNKWEIRLETKQRRLQLARRLWTDPINMNHTIESASLVAKLVGVVEQGQVLKEMFGLSFIPQRRAPKAYRWMYGAQV